MLFGMGNMPQMGPMMNNQALMGHAVMGGQPMLMGQQQMPPNHSMQALLAGQQMQGAHLNMQGQPQMMMHQSQAMSGQPMMVPGAAHSGMGLEQGNVYGNGPFN